MFSCGYAKGFQRNVLKEENETSCAAAYHKILPIIAKTDD
jgi:hypothetical protein